MGKASQGNALGKLYIIPTMPRPNLSAPGNKEKIKSNIPRIKRTVRAKYQRIFEAYNLFPLFIFSILLLPDHTEGSLS